MSGNSEFKPGPEIPMSGHVQAFAMIVDLNKFTVMVGKAEEMGVGVAQFVSEALSGAIRVIEAEGGEVVAFMGDAVLAIFTDGENAISACFGIARNLDRQCEYVSDAQANWPELWSFAPGGPSFKISIEYGPMDISTVASRFLGQHRLVIGSPINSAERISKAGLGNRCIVGPAAAAKAFDDYNLNGPHFIPGKEGETSYEYYYFSLGDLWIEGPRAPDRDTYWG